MGKRKSTKVKNTKVLNETFIFEEEYYTMLSCIEEMLNTLEDSALAADKVILINSYRKYIADLQEISLDAALLLPIFVEGSSDGNSITISNIARFLGCKRVSIMQSQFAIDELVNRKVLRRTSNSNNEQPGYKVTEEAMTAFKNNVKFVPQPKVAKDGIHLLRMIGDLTAQCRRGEINSVQLKEDFEQTLQENADLQFVKRLQRLNLPVNSQLIVAQMAVALVLNQQENVSSERLKCLFDDQEEAFDEMHSMKFGRNILMRRNMVEYAGTDEFLNSTLYKLTQKAREKLLKGFHLPKNNEVNVSAVKSDSIAEKNLFFNAEVGRQIECLSELLSEESFAAIQARLAERGRRTGVACLFYGSPGTGKTESVLQIARKTGRDIMQVDMSTIRSKWVGESEQNIKAVFTNYRALCKVSEKTPILLFNEADAVLGTRMGNALTAVDKMNNSMQNIVLQEMETFDGILFATTNLEKALDSAFERRFLYKVRFERPDVEQRKNIWRSMLPTLTDDTVLQLVASYDFSGGQIENIVRKCDVESILHGETAVDTDKILRFCQEESILKQNFSRIGFV